MLGKFTDAYRKFAPGEKIAKHKNSTQIIEINYISYHFSEVRGSFDARQPMDIIFTAVARVAII